MLGESGTRRAELGTVLGTGKGANVPGEREGKAALMGGRGHLGQGTPLRE